MGTQAFPSIGLGPTESIYTIKPEHQAWPEPEMINRETEDYRGQRAVATMVKDARSKGWTVRVTEAKGSFPTVGGKPSRQRWSLAVRMSRGTDRAVAVYTEAPTEGNTWSWDTLYRWTLGEAPTKYATVTALKAVL